jgi:hypothetical protein
VSGIGGVLPRGVVAQVRRNPTRRVTVSDMSSPVIAAHIHRGAAGTNGPIVVPFVAPTTGMSQGCVSVADALLNEIRSDPGGFYVNVHTTAHPGGEIRGKLTRDQ